ncbi:uncharacterized protein [Narcine bancroftii]|uniref:uncharacterized protein n=1 Tax=Narcine bancroftii TaxID=1343680 RepID=UPI00383158D9
MQTQYFKAPEATLNKATRTLETISLDFKGPLPSNNKNVYFLTVIDEYSRFPFAIPCPVIKGLDRIFSIFGFPSYVHTDRGSAFMSAELRRAMLRKGIATSRTMSYTHRAMGRSKGTVWKTVNLALKTHGYPVTWWQDVLPEALHSTWSLLCTATNQTPHERMFAFPRKSGTVMEWPACLSEPGTVLLKSHTRTCETDPLIQPSNYAHVKFPDGSTHIVLLRDLALSGSPLPHAPTQSDPERLDSPTPPPAYNSKHSDGHAEAPLPHVGNSGAGPEVQPSHTTDPRIVSTPPAPKVAKPATVPIRKSTHIHKQPERLQYS